MTKAEQERLVACLVGFVAALVRTNRPLQCPTVSAGNHMRIAPAFSQALDQGNGCRCLSSPACIDIADTDHRHACKVLRGAGDSAGCCGTLERRERGKQTRLPCGAVRRSEPEERRAHQTASSSSLSWI